MKRVIVPLDGSVLSEHALPLAAFLATTLERDMELVHVIDTMVGETIQGWAVDPTPESMKQEISDSVERAALPVSPSVSVFAGDPVARLLHLSEQEPDAIIVMATHGRGGFGRMLLGSVADKVVRGARPGGAGAARAL